MRQLLVWVCGAGVVLFAALQFLPATQTNPPVEYEVAWDSPRTRDLFYRACADCHSHETSWPWYSKVSPVSWLIANHVREGRRDMNISVPDEIDVTEAVAQIRNNQMPPADYQLMHPEARLDEAEKADLISGLKKTF